MRPTSDRRLRRAAVSVAAALALAGCGAGGGSAAAQLLDDDPDWEYSPDTTECVITHVRSQIDDSNEVSAGDLVASMTAGRADETGVGLDRCVSDAERLWTATQIGMEANAEDDCSVQQIAEMLDLTYPDFIRGRPLIAELDADCGADPTDPESGLVDPDEPEAQIDAEEVSVFSLSVGDCFAERSDAETVSDVDIVDCDARHDAEVYALFELDDADGYPGDDEAFTLGREGCLERFEEYVGIDYRDSKWWGGQFTPSEGSWNRQDDREVACYLYDPDGPANASAQGSGV